MIDFLRFVLPFVTVQTTEKMTHEYQQRCMCSFIDRSGEILRDACSWPSATCDGSGIVIGVEKGMHKGKFYIEWLPSTVREINLSKAELLVMLHVDQLPRETRICNLDVCEIYGTVDLERLPLHIKQLSLKGNNIRGEISLLDLPPSIQVINLRQNFLEKVIVSSEKLPVRLLRVLVSHRNLTIRVGLVNVGVDPIDRFTVCID